MSEWDRAESPVIAWGPTVQAGQLGVDAGLIKEHELFGVKSGHLRTKLLALLDNIRAPLFGGPECLFLRDNFSRWSVRHSTAALTRMPVRSCNWVQYSARVASLSASTRRCNSSRA